MEGVAGLRAKKGTSGTVPVTFTWPLSSAKAVFVVGNFDRFLRHPLKKQPSGCFTTVLQLVSGDFLYKFIVDGEYHVRHDLGGQYIFADKEGTQYNKLHVSRRESFVLPESTSSSLSPEDGSEKSRGLNATDNNINLARNAVVKRERKSILRRASEMFNRRTSNSSAVPAAQAAASMATATTPSTTQSPTDESVVAAAPKHQAQPVNKENVNNGNTNPRASWRRSLKPNRSSLVSAPLTVDAVDPAEVESKVKQWKEYAKTLQHWGDFDGAAVLYNQAVTLMKESDMANTAACADIHVDLAHTLSRKEDYRGSEDNIKRAIAILNHTGFDRRERHGDLLSYLAVMIDRQRRRSDAEMYYQEALRVYRENKITGENVNITLKNLRINLRKQGKDAEEQLNRTMVPDRASTVQRPRPSAVGRTYR